MDLPFKIDVISTYFPSGNLTSNRRRIDEDVSIGMICKVRKIAVSMTGEECDKVIDELRV